jgi:hypothetical protein
MLYAPIPKAAPKRTRARVTLLTSLLLVVMGAAIAFQGHAIYQLQRDSDLAWEALYELFVIHGIIEEEGEDVDAKPYGIGESGELYL